MRLLATTTCAALLIAVMGVGVASPAFADDPAPQPSSSASTPTDSAPSADPGAITPATPTTEPPATAATAPVQTPAVASALPLDVGSQGWRVRELQRRLAWLGHSVGRSETTQATFGPQTRAAVKKFQMKFFMYPNGVVDGHTWSRLRAISGTIGRLPSACTHERTICVDKEQMLLRLVEGGKVTLTLDARFGLEGVRTREGSFRIHLKSRHHISSLYGSSMPFALFFSGSQAVHYSPYFARYGYNGGSHGCIGIRDYAKAGWLFDRVGIGTKVYVYWSRR